MKQPVLAVTALAACLASPALGDTIDPARAALFIDTIRGNDCAMSEEQAGTILPALGFDQEETSGYVELLFLADLVMLDHDRQVLTLAEQLCAADAAGDAATFARAVGGRAALFIDAVRRNDCAISEDQAEDLLPELGLEWDEVGNFVDVLLEAELVSFSDDGSVLTLSDPLCTADASDDALTYFEAATGITDLDFGEIDR